MPIEISQSFSRPASECYQAVIDLLPRQGFEIVRRRDIAWLVQARKNVQGRWMSINVLCKPGAQTQAIVTCPDYGDAQQGKIAIEALCEAIRGRLG